MHSIGIPFQVGLESGEFANKAIRERQARFELAPILKLFSNYFGASVVSTSRVRELSYTIEGVFNAINGNYAHLFLFHTKTKIKISVIFF